MEKEMCFACGDGDGDGDGHELGDSKLYPLLQQAFESPESEAEKSTPTIEVEVISRENVKPSSPTPDHLRTYQLSTLDQLSQTKYIPLVFFFYPSTDQNTHVILERLKLSLSQTLTRFYPFAGKVKDNVSVNCNDEGAYFVVAKVNHRLSTFLHDLDFKNINGFIPQTKELQPSGMYLLMVQVNIFTCGGIALCSSILHKLADGQTRVTLLKDWANTSRGSSQVVSPSFIAPSLFPQQSFLPPLFDAPFSIKHNVVTKRIVFDALGIANLKRRVASASFSFSSDPTRVVLVSALLWKCVVAASRSNPISTKKVSVFNLVVDLRRRKSIPLPEETVGNMIWSASAQCKPDMDLDLCRMVSHIMDSIKEISSGFVEELIGDKGHLKIIECLSGWAAMLSENGEFNLLGVSSLCNFGFYEVDFGWGRPKWFHLYNLDTGNLVVLADTRSKGGIEVLVTLKGEDMALFELDPELLEFASINNDIPV